MSDLSLRRLLAWRLSANLFARACGFTPDPWQARVLQSARQQIALLCSRQSGKSSVTGVLATQAAVTLPAEPLILLFAPSERQAGEVLKKIKGNLTALGDDAPRLVKDNERSITLANGARVIALHNKEASVRGFSAPALVIFDEAARVQDALYEAVRPMLAVGKGRLIALSSAWDERGWFYDEWSNGSGEWLRVKVPATECPRIDPAWLEAERTRVPHRVFQREYMCEFGDTEENVFSAALIQSVMSRDVIPLSPLRRAA